MNQKKKTLNLRAVKPVLLPLLILLPFALFFSMGIPVLSYVVYGLLLVTFGLIATIS